MKKKIVYRRLLFWLFLLVAVTANAQRQRFFNLTVEDIEIDSLLPQFTYAIPVGENYADSVYQLEIRYPEFIDMSKEDEARYAKICGSPLPSLPSITQQMVVEKKKGILEFSLVPLVERDGKKQFLVSFMIAMTSRPNASSSKKAKNVAKASGAADRYASHSVLASGRWAKIRVPSDGVYQLTEALVKKAGFSNLAHVKIYGYGGNLQNEKLVGSELAELDDLPEVPSCTVNGKRLFYGKGPVSWNNASATRRTRNPYSNYGYYFLTESDETPLSVDSAAFLQSFYPSADDYHSLHEIDNYSWYQGGRNLFENRPIYAGSSKVYTLPNTAHATSGILSVSVTAGQATTVQVEFNDSLVGQQVISLGEYDNGSESRAIYSVEGLQATDSIKISTISGGPARLDYISMAYNQPRPAPDLAQGSFPSPEYVYNITNQDHHADKEVDMVIIIPTSQKLLSPAQRLADFHEQHDSLKVKIVPADELYNEFSSGTPDANAYRRYLKMLYDRAETEEQQPKYLLLFGDAVWDNRMLTSDCKAFDPDDYLLAFESENSFSELYCYVDDGWFTLLDDGEGTNQLSSDKQDVAVGRFPVTTLTDAEAVVDKTISYAEDANAGAWQNVIVFMGDDGNQNLHMRDVNETADKISSLYPNYQVKKVMWDAYTRVSSSTGNTYPEVSSIIKQQQALGALIFDYAGHGRPDQISHESVLRLNDFRNFSNSNLPLWITASCDIMPFDGTEATIGETALLNSKGGAVAFYGTTRTVYANYNKSLNTTFLKYVLRQVDGKPTPLGEAQRLTKNEMITTGQDRTANKLQYSLLGDPALSLNLPRQNVVIDSLAGVKMGTAELPELRAGAIVTIKGHVEKNGLADNSFNGLVTVVVRDTRELVTCKKNDPIQTKTAFTFYDRQKTLYTGSDSVRNGFFEMTFAVPRDINYADGTGLINTYAVSSDHQSLANGAESRLLVNGTDTVSNDSIGPSIYCYLNSPSFVNGGTVNATPYFVAQVTDKDGINASGSGIGHDLQLTIDGDMQKTYNLNDHFTFDFGSFTKGSTYYNIPELSEGPHTLTFRAWDVLNNPSTAKLSFNVVKGLQPEIASVSCTNNPATTSTTFIVTHNFMGSQVDLVIDVFDMSGRLLWQHSESGVSSSNAYTVSWDLTVDGGARLQTGVYLYRVRLSSDGGSQATKAKKLVVIGNK